MSSEYGVAAPRNQTVVGVILEATVGCRGYVACCIVGKHFLCQNIVVRILDGSLDDTIQAIITITEFGAFVKMFFCDDFRQYLARLLTRVGCSTVMHFKKKLAVTKLAPTGIQGSHGGKLLFGRARCVFIEKTVLGSVN